MENIKRINDHEYQAVDPQTGGTWHVIAPHKLNEGTALLAIAQAIEQQDMRPGKGTTLTVHFEIKIAKVGEKPTPMPRLRG